jgi:hypothetical protein
MTEEERRAEKRAYNQKYYAGNRDNLKAKQREWRVNNKDAAAAGDRKRKYGLDPVQFAAMLSAQNNSCAICFATEAKGPGTFHVDHCHTSGVIRGLLCHSCNVGLGHFRDDTALLMRATEYLDAARTLQ